MKIFNNECNLEKLILGLYFFVVSIEITAEMFSYKPVIFIFKPLIPIVLMWLYWYTSNKRNALFFVTVFFSLITNVFFIFDTERMLFLGLIVYFIHRLLLIFYIIKLTKLKDYVPMLIAMIPFVFFFFYLLSLTSEANRGSYEILIILNILISIIAGITLSEFVMNNSKKDSSWLFIFGLLSIAQYFIVGVEKYLLLDLSLISFRIVAMILNMAVYFSFYKFVIGNERLNINRLSKG